MGGIAKIDVSTLHPGHFLDLRIFLFEPLSHHSLVAFHRLMQRLLAGDAQLHQQATYRRRASALSSDLSGAPIGAIALSC